jgi:hypothetical protein
MPESQVRGLGRTSLREPGRRGLLRPVPTWQSSLASPANARLWPLQASGDRRGCTYSRRHRKPVVRLLSFSTKLCTIRNHGRASVDPSRLQLTALEIEPQPRNREVVVSCGLCLGETPIGNSDDLAKDALSHVLYRLPPI